MRIIGKIFATITLMLLLSSCEGSYMRSILTRDYDAPQAPAKVSQAFPNNQIPSPPVQNPLVQNNPIANIPNQQTPFQTGQIPPNFIYTPIPSQPPKIIQKKVKIAALLPLTGKSKELGTAMLNSVTLSLFENDQNNDIELVVLDSSDIKKAADAIISQNIKTVIGPIFSSDVEALNTLISNQQISILSFSNNQDLANKKNVFLMGFLPEQQIERVASYAVLAGKDNFAIIAPNNSYGQKFSNILQEMAKRKDGNFISAEFYTNSNKDLERAVSKVVSSYILPPRVNKKNKKNFKDADKFYANAILIPESGAVLSKIVNLIKKYNVSEREIQIIGSSNWDDISTLNDPNLIGAWFTSADPAKYRDFERRYYQIYNKFPPRISSVGYDAVLATVNVIKKSGKRDLATEDFINYQSAKNGFEGIDGLFRFLPNGIVQRNFAVLQVNNGKFDMIDSSSSMFFKY